MTNKLKLRQVELRSILQQAQSTDYYFLIDVVGTCNLRCPSCAVGNYSLPEAKGLMTVETYQSVLEKIERENPNKKIFIHLYNYGEPILHKKLSEIIKLTKNFGFGCGISCNLNVFPNMADVIRSDPTYIRISLSGFKNSIYQKNHKQGDINVVKSNMHLIRHYLDKYSVDTIIQVGFHTYRNNFPDDFFRMREMCMDLDFIFAPTLASMSPAEKAILAVDGLPLDEAAQSVQDDLVVSMKRRSDLLKNDRANYSDCQFRKMSTTINFDGSVALCCATYEKTQLISENFLNTSQNELNDKKYSHSFCKSCQSRNLDLHYTGVGEGQKTIEEEAIKILGDKYRDFLSDWNVSIEPTINWNDQDITIQDACDLAAEKRNIGNLLETKSLYSLVYKAAPKHAEARFQLGLLAEQEGNYISALEMYDEAIELYPGHSNYVTQRNSLKAKIS